MADMTAPNIFVPAQSGGMDSTALAAILANKQDGMNSPLTLVALLAMMRNMGFDTNRNWDMNQNADRAAIDAAVSAALAQNNQANNNAMLLLKDIQDSSQEVVSAVQAASNAGIAATMNAEIANLQGQGNITTAISDTKYTTVNEVHEAATDIIASTTANTQQLAATLNALAMSLQAGHAEINAAVAQAKYDNTITTMNEGEKTRAALAAAVAQLPTSRELDLQRQLAVALDDHRHTVTRGNIEQGNVSVITTVNQNQQQQQNQTAIFRELDILRNELQRNTQSTIAIGSTMLGNSQTATNVRQ